MGWGKTMYPASGQFHLCNPIHTGRDPYLDAEETDAKIRPTLYSTLTTARRCRNTAGISAHLFRFSQVLYTP